MIDILIASASRLEYLKRTVKSLQKKLHYKDEFRWILHEDVVRNLDSTKVIKWAIGSGIFDKIKMTFPAKRHGNAIKELLNMAESKYVFRTEDDWIFKKKVNLDEVIEIFEKDATINQISFRGDTTQTDESNEIEKEGRILTVFQEWNCIPSVWRLDWVKPRWVPTNRGEISYHLINRITKEEFVKLADKEWLQKNLGSYWWGGMEENGYVEHIGLDSVLYIPIEGRK